MVGDERDRWGKRNDEPDVEAHVHKENPEEKKDDDGDDKPDVEAHYRPSK